MSELATAYVNIVPSAKGIGGNISKALGGESASAGISAGNVFGGNLVGTLSKVIAAAGIGKLIGDSIKSGADLEQSIGGIETLFGAGGAKSVQEYAAQVGKSVDEVSQEFDDLSAAQERMTQYANDAYKTAGLSANDYMQTVSSFAASLKQSTGGDLEALTSAANQAVIDMSDNANKMGTDMSSIQNAYQGFAKQNYTMLDNLKLGYGGTKTEMERLLKDAEKLSGQKYDIGNLADVYSAIHVVQEELGITGTTSKEAAQTISGSLSSMKASFQNVLGKIAIGEDISSDLNALVETVSTFAGNNLLPALKNVFTALPGALQTLFNSFYPIVSKMVGDLFKKLPELIKTGASTFTSNMGTILDDLIGAVNDGSAGSGASEFGATLLNIISTAIDSVVASASVLLPKLWELASSIISQLFEAIVSNAPMIGESGSALITNFSTYLQENLPTLLEQGVAFITNVVNGILSALPTLISSAGQLITAFVSGILPMLPTIMENGVQLVLNLIEGIISALPDVLAAVGELVLSLIGALIENAPQLLETGVTLIGEVIAGLIKGLVKLGSAVHEFETQFRQKIKDIDWRKIGTDIINAIISGIKAGGSAIGGALKELFSGALSGGNGGGALSGGGSKTPSSAGRGAGNSYVMGMADGIRENAPIVQDAIKNLTSYANDDFKGIAEIQSRTNVSMGQRGTTAATMATLERRLDTLSANLETYSTMVASGRSVNVTLHGDAKTMFKAVRNENNMFRTATGRGVFA